MKKSLVIIGALVLVLFLTAIALPVIFKGRIQKAVDSSIAESVRAEVSYGDFSLSLLKGFPNLNLSLDQLSIVGIDLFEGDTLMAAEQISVTVNPIEALFSDKLTINRIDLVCPKWLVRVLENGATNYDITIESESEDSEESTYQLGINKWTIEDGSLIYEDQQTAIFIDLKNINHEGSGDFSQDLFELETSSQLTIRSLTYQGLPYLSNKEILADIILDMNLPEAKYTFRENQVSINQFAFGFDGWLSMPEDSEDMLMDLSFATKQNEFRHLLSCVPGMYGEGFENITSSGLVTMSGNIKGTYNDAQVPAFKFSLKVDNGMFQYPELPTAVKNINFEMLAVNEDGNLDHTVVDLSKLHLEFGENPLDGSLLVNGLSTPDIKMNLKTSLDLAELTGMFPMDGTTLKGTYELALKAEGTYDSAAQRFPIVDASMKLLDGFIKSDEFPESLEQFNFISTVSNQSGHLPDTRIDVPDFSFTMDGESFSGRLSLMNPDDYSWDLAVDGGLNLEKLTHVLSMDDMVLKGIIRGNLATTGKMSSLEAENYQDIPTSGDFKVTEFSYSSPELDHPFEISSGGAAFTPQQITLTDINALTGASDFKISGNISNYINYVFDENAPISGALDIESSNLDLNQWMTETGDTDAEEALSVLEIPSNIDFDLQAKAATVKYDNMTLRNVRGQVQLKDGVAQMHDLSFNSLGGGFLVGGTYDPRDHRHPKFNMEIEMQEVAIKEAFNTFNTVQILAPVAEFMTGNFSTSFNLNGELKQDMMPALGSLTGNGLVSILTAALSGGDSKLVNGFTEVTQFSNNSSAGFTLKDVVMAMKIENGQLEVAPFLTSYGEYQAMVSGSTGIDGTMNFLLNMEVPAGVVGASVNQAIASLTGSQQQVDDKVKLNLNLSGSYANPKFSIGGIQDGNTTASLAKSAVSQKSNEVKDSAETVINQETKKLTETAQLQLDSLISGGVEDSTSSEILKEATKDLLNEEKVGEVLNLFKKKKKSDEAAKDEGAKDEGGKN